MKPLVAT